MTVTSFLLIVIDASVALAPGELRLLRMGAWRSTEGTVRQAGSAVLPAQELRQPVPSDGPTPHTWTLPGLLALTAITAGHVPRTSVWTIGIESLAYGESLTPRVAVAVAQLSQRLQRKRAD